MFYIIRLRPRVLVWYGFQSCGKKRFVILKKHMLLMDEYHFVVYRKKICVLYRQKVDKEGECTDLSVFRVSNISWKVYIY
jgi:hypothetical protein